MPGTDPPATKRTRSHRRLRAFLAAIAGGFVGWGFHVVFQHLGWLSPGDPAWLPIVVFAIGGFCLGNDGWSALVVWNDAADLCHEDDPDGETPKHG